MTTAMPLSTLLKGIYPLHARNERNVTGITLDSRHVAPGDVFMACKGERFDARQFIDKAAASGAAAILVEADDVDWCCERFIHEVPVLPVVNLHDQMAELASRFFGEPGKQLRLIGVTGTNGKTSTTQLLAEALHQTGRRCGVIGTLGHGIIDEPLHSNVDGPGTTPDAVKLQQIFDSFKRAEADTVVMEVSSHALEQRRVLVDDFTVAVFTNLSRDHLDYHGTMAAYGAAKRKLFAGRSLQLAVLNADDPYVAATRAELDGDVRCFTWSVYSSAADVFASEVRFTPSGIAFQLNSPWGAYPVQSALLGSFNISNLLAVMTTTLASEALNADFAPGRLVAAVAALPTVIGRMQLVGEFPVTAVVDYAHTPDGLEKALQAVREHCRGQLWCVFGCGGDRDKGKRPLMAAIAEAHADHLVLTDDNPRYEDPAQILLDMQSGLRSQQAAIVIGDRAAALEYALTQANAGDVVLIAGKGHENYQDVAGVKLPFSDQQQAMRVLSRRFGDDASIGRSA